jgi:hypothetical protein
VERREPGCHHLVGHLMSQIRTFLTADVTVV